MNHRSDAGDDEALRPLPRGVLTGLCSHLLSDSLAAVVELNGQLLDALSSSAQTAREFPLGPKLRARFAALSALQRRQVAQSGVLLADVGFSNSDRWHSLVFDGEHLDRGMYSEWLAVEDAVALTSTVLLVAWHILRVRPSIAGFLLGMPESTVSTFRQLGVADLTRVARRHPHWVRPRWPDRLDLWSSILDADTSSQDPASVVLRCLKASAGLSSRLLLSVESTV